MKASLLLKKVEHYGNSHNLLPTLRQQRYRCKSCKKQSRENPAKNGYTDERREEIIKSYQERSSLRGLTRTFGVSRNTVKDWLKKSSSSAALEGNVDLTRPR
jgi:transposase-like protein